MRTSKSRTEGLRTSKIGLVDTSDCETLPGNHSGLLLRLQNSKSIDNCNCLGMPALFGLVNTGMGELSGP